MSSNKSVGKQSTKPQLTLDEMDRLLPIVSRHFKEGVAWIFPPKAEGFVEYKPRKATIEATVFFRHSDDKKYRCDLEFNLEASKRDVEFTMVKMYNDFLRDGVTRVVVGSQQVTGK